MMSGKTFVINKKRYIHNDEAEFILLKSLIPFITFLYCLLLKRKKNLIFRAILVRTIYFNFNLRTVKSPTALHYAYLLNYSCNMGKTPRQAWFKTEASTRRENFTYFDFPKKSVLIEIIMLPMKSLIP